MTRPEGLQGESIYVRLDEAQPGDWYGHWLITEVVTVAQGRVVWKYNDGESTNGMDADIRTQIFRPVPTGHVLFVGGD